MEFLATLRPTPSRECTNQRAYVDRKLKLCAHVFIKNNAPKSCLERAYTSPYLVLDKQEKYFTVDFGSRNDVVSIDRLKAANLFRKFEDNDQIQSEINSQEFTHSISTDSSSGDGIGLENLFATGELPNSSQKSADEQKPEMLRIRHGRIFRPPHRFR